jgi:hypothetical protein
MRQSVRHVAAFTWRAEQVVSIGYKASAFDNAKTTFVPEKSLRDKDLTASIEVNS